MNENPQIPEQSPTASQTEQILNSFNPDARPKQVAPEWEPFYQRLLRLKDRLIDSQNDLDGKAREIRPDETLEEPSETATDTFHRDYALGMSSFQQDFIAEVMGAIDRIENGTYGICEVTGEKIPRERLDAVPWARTTVEGQRQLEETGQAAISGIGPRGTMSSRGISVPGARRDDGGSL